MVITECGAAFDDHPDEPDSCHTTTAPNTSQRTPPPSALPGRRGCARVPRVVADGQLPARPPV